MNAGPRCVDLRLLALGAVLLCAPAAHAGFLTPDTAYAGFRIPEHRWSSWTAFVSAGGYRSLTPVNERYFYRSTSLNGRLGTKAQWSYDSEGLQHELRFSVDGNGYRDKRDTRSFDYHEVARNDDLEQRILFGASMDSYPWSRPVGLALASEHLLELRQNFYSYDREQGDPFYRWQSTRSEGIGHRDYVGRLSAGARLGRVRDATPVYQARVLEQRLLRAGSLSGALSEQTRRRLAALFAVQGDVARAHQYPDKYFWREVERVLRDDGALRSGSLGAFDLLRALEPYALSRRVLRRVGSFVGPTISVLTQRTHLTQDLSYSERTLFADSVVYEYASRTGATTNDRTADIVTSIVAETRHPIGDRWQADASTSLGITDGGEAVVTSALVAGSWMISDRWLAWLQGWQSGYTTGRSERRMREWRTELSADLYYFLEDSWALFLSARESQSHHLSSFQRYGSFQLGVTYVVSGLFEAPGLVPAMRPTPPSP